MTPNKLPPLPEKFRKRPVVIEAVQLDGTEAAFNAAIAFMGGASGAHNGHLPDSDPNKSWLYIDTMEGQMTAKTGDWIIKGVKGEFYPCKPDIFAATYEPAEALRQSQSLPAGAVADVRRVIHELRTYNPAADEYKGQHIHGVWARELEQALQADAREKGEAVAWQWRYREDPGLWFYCSNRVYSEMSAHPEHYETRALYATQPAQASEAAELSEYGRKAVARCIKELTYYAEHPDDHGFDQMGVQALQTAIESMQIRLEKR